MHLPLDDIFHVKCACHIYNLTVKSGLELFKPETTPVRRRVGVIQKIIELLEPPSQKIKKASRVEELRISAMYMVLPLDTCLKMLLLRETIHIYS